MMVKKIRDILNGRWKGKPTFRFDWIIGNHIGINCWKRETLHYPARPGHAEFITGATFNQFIHIHATTSAKCGSFWHLLVPFFKFVQWKKQGELGIPPSICKPGSLHRVAVWRLFSKLSTLNNIIETYCSKMFLQMASRFAIFQLWAQELHAKPNQYWQGEGKKPHTIQRMLLYWPDCVPN